MFGSADIGLGAEARTSGFQEHIDVHRMRTRYGSRRDGKPEADDIISTKVAGGKESWPRMDTDSHKFQKLLYSCESV